MITITFTMQKHKFILFLLISAFLSVIYPAYAQSYISEKSFQSNRLLHSGSAQSSFSEPVAGTSVIAFAPMSYSGVKGYSVGGYRIQSHSRYSSKVYSPFSSSSPSARRAGSNPFEGGDDDDDDNFNETGGTGDGQGNAGDPLKDPMPLPDGILFLSILGIIYFSWFSKKGKKIVLFQMIISRFSAEKD